MGGEQGMVPVPGMVLVPSMVPVTGVVSNNPETMEAMINMKDRERLS